MPKNTAVKGRRFEHEVRAFMESCGFYVVRSAGSKGAFDLVCFPSLEAVDPVARLWGKEDISYFPAAFSWLGVSCKSGVSRDTGVSIRAKGRVAYDHGGALLLARRKAGRVKPGEQRWTLRWA